MRNLRPKNYGVRRMSGPRAATKSPAFFCVHHSRCPLRVASALRKTCNQFLQKDMVLAPSEHIGQDLSGVMINGMPQPARVRFLGYIGPHFVQLGGQATTYLQLIRTT